jgi:hypothetical protein
MGRFGYGPVIPKAYTFATQVVPWVQPGVCCCSLLGSEHPTAAGGAARRTRTGPPVRGHRRLGARRLATQRPPQVLPDSGRRGRRDAGAASPPPERLPQTSGPRAPSGSPPRSRRAGDGPWSGVAGPGAGRGQRGRARHGAWAATVDSQRPDRRRWGDGGVREGRPSRSLWTRLQARLERASICCLRRATAGPPGVWQRASMCCAHRPLHRVAHLHPMQMACIRCRPLRWAPAGSARAGRRPLACGLRTRPGGPVYNRVTVTVFTMAGDRAGPGWPARAAGPLRLLRGSPRREAGAGHGPGRRARAGQR